MFLRWIPQLLANVDGEKIFAVAEIVEKIAVTYPQAIMYAYRLSKKNYSLENSNTETLRLIQRCVFKLCRLLFLLTFAFRLDELLLTDDLINTFLKALSCVTIPSNILGDYIKTLYKQSDKPQTEFNASIDSVIEQVFIEKPDSGDVTKFYGNAFKSITSFKKRLEDLKREESPQKRATALKMLIEQLQAKKSTNLKDYCPWLANFHSVDFDTVLEIPGQYTGLKKPLPQYHVKIAGFQSQVSSMNSVRKPIKLTILGNDAKEYSYLVKYAEDLRQDQRMEQLFYLMNDIFRNDYESSVQHLSIVTYQVFIEFEFAKELLLGQQVL